MILLVRGVKSTFQSICRVGFLWLWVFFFTSSVLANPVLDHVRAGNVSIQQVPNSTIVNQSSGRAIINWRSFNIGVQESTHFQQPAGGVALNRINANQGPSSIYGRLTATGQIVLVNSAGIFFGPSAYVNVGGLIATTADISDSDFLNGIYRFNGVSPSGSIINQGQLIAANHGLIALLGNGVQNDGLIQANLGHVVLASGGSFTMSFAGNDLISFSVDGKALQGISNTGTLSANGGSILVTARTTQKVLDNTINMHGFVEARSIQEKNGEIIISGDPDAGVVNVAAKLDVSGKNAGERGGNVTITGHNILLDSPTVIDASGDRGGGNIFVGGNAHGVGPLPHSNAVVMMPDTIILADAKTYGNGGNVVLWSDNVTKAYGTISARGGSESGNGGFIETSGHYLDVSGININTFSPHGKFGTWLLDPTDVTISTAADSNATFGSSIYQPTNGALASTNINTTNLQNQLATTNVTVTTTPVSGSGGGGSGNITVADPITWAAATTLTLEALNNIIINAAISAVNGSLVLSAVNAAQSITTGSDGSINVANFNLLQGQWYQVGSLPSFIVTNDFQINSGVLPAGTAQFIRATSGDGGATPYQIVDVYGLQGIGSSATTLAANFNLSNAIDASGTINWNDGAGFKPIGNDIIPYSGTLNGNGFIINDLYINQNSSYLGLIGALSGNAWTIGLRDAVINANSSGDFYVGALAGFNSGLITDSFSLNGTITSIVDYVGGLVGDNTGTINNSYATGTISAPDRFYVGGLVGASSGSIDQTWSGVNVSGSTFVGGLVGFVGSPPATSVSNSYSIGSVTGTGFYIGGLVGQLLDSLATVEKSYSTSLVTAPSTTTAGAFIGNNQGTGNVSDSFWDSSIITGYITNGFGTTSTDSSGATGQTTATLKTQATFSGAGWDIGVDNTWAIFDGYTRPMLGIEYNLTINNAHQLQLMALPVIAAYTIASDIDASGITNPSDVWGTSTTSGNGFVPIGNITTTFQGSLDGQNHVIDSLYINRPLDDYIGLFGAVSGTTIQNVGLTNVNITGGSAVGGLIGILDDTTIFRTYSAGNVSGSGSHIGGLIGYVGVTNPFIPVSFSISESFSLGTVTSTGSGQSNIGGLAGFLNTFNPESGEIINSYSMANVLGGSSTSVGGLVGFANNTANVYNSYSTGYVITSGDSSAGLIGFDNAAIVQNTFWDTGTSGTTYPGDFVNFTPGNNAAGLSTSDLMTQSNLETGSIYISGTGWDFTNIWGIIEGQSYPYLRAFHSSTPRAISGTSSASGPTDANTSVKLVVDGTLIDTAYTGNNGAFYFLAENGTIANNANVLTYLSGSTLKGNSIAIAPTSGGSLSGSTQLTITSDAVNIGNSSTTSYSNSILSTAKGTLNDNDILFSVSGGNLTIGNATNPNINLNTSNPTTYNIDGNISVQSGGTGSFTFGGPVVLSTNPTLTTTSGNITFSSTLNSLTSARTLVLNSAGTTTFGGIVGDTLALSSLTTDSAGSTAINGGSVTTTGAQTYNDAVTLGTDVILSTTNSDVSFGSTLNSFNATPRALIINAGAGGISLVNDVGSLNPLDAMTLNSTSATTFGGAVSASSLTTNAGGTTSINGGTVTTTAVGGQVYNDNVSLGANTILSASSGPITFSGTLNSSGSNRTLALNSSGITTFSGAVGTGLALSSLTTDSGGTTAVNGGAVTTTGNQTYNDGITINNNDATFTSTAGNINFAQTIDIDSAATIGYNLIFNAADVLTFGGRVASSIPAFLPISLTATADTINLNGGISILLASTVNTSDAQTYIGAVVLGADTLLQSVNGDVSFLSDATHTSSIDSDSVLTPRELSIFFVGNNIFSADIGAINPLASLTSTPLPVGPSTGIYFQDSLNPSNVINVTTVGDQIYGDDIHLDNPVVLTSTTGDIIFNTTDIGGPIVGGNVIGGGSTAFAVSNAGTSSGAVGTITGVTLTKEGGGTFQLSGANTTGTTTINGGKLQLNTGASLAAASTIVLANTAGAILDLNGNNQTIAGLSGGGTSGGNISLGSGTLTVNETGTETYGGTISGSGGFTKSGSGTLILGGANTYTGKTTVGAGVLSITAENNLGGNPSLLTADQLTFNGGTLQTTGTFSIDDSNRGITLGISGGTFDVVSGTLTLANIIAGSGSLTKSNSGALTLNNSNTYGGGTNINAGTVNIGNVASLGSGIATVVSSAILNISSTLGTIANALNLAGSGSGTGAIVNAGTNTLSGAVTLSANTAIGVTGTSDALTFSNVINDAGSSFSLTKLGAGTLTLSNANTYDGGTTLGAGTLAVGNNAALGTGVLALNGGTLRSTGTVVLPNTFTLGGNSSISGANNITINGTGTLNNGNTLTNDNTAITTLGGNLSGAGSLAQNTGTLVLGGNNTNYTGVLSFNGGTLSIANNQGLGDANITIGNGTTLDLNTVNLNNNLTLNNGALSITGASILTGTLTLASGSNNTIIANPLSSFTLNSGITGNGDLTLQGTGVYNINSNINSSSLTANSIVTLGNVTIQTTGSQTYANTLTLAANAALTSTGSNIDFNSTINGSFDLNVNSAGTLGIDGAIGGTLALNSLTLSGSGITLNGGSVATIGNQTYNGLVTLGADTSFTTSGPGTVMIAMNNGISGNRNVTLTGNVASDTTFSLAGTMNVNNLTVNSTGGTNTLAVNTGSTQQWNINGGNSGNITGLSGVTGNFNFSNISNLTGGSGNDVFMLNGGTLAGSINGSNGNNSLIADNIANTWNLSGINAGTVTGISGTFSNIQNLIGGSNGNNFILANAARVGTINGGSLASTNILDYSNYGAPVLLYLSSTNVGTAKTGSQVIASYSNINQVMGDYVNDDIIAVGKTFIITYTGNRQGYINDPLFFFGSTVNGNATAPTLSSELNVSGIIQQPVINGDSSSNSSTTSMPAWVVISNSTTQNMTDLLQQFTTEYEESLKKIIINPTCFATH